MIRAFPYVLHALAFGWFAVIGVGGPASRAASVVACVYVALAVVARARSTHR
jgi:hypothetical protein